MSELDAVAPAYCDAEDLASMRNPEHLKQPMVPRLLGDGPALPSDIDSIYEHHDRCWVWVEVKYMQIPLSTGQTLLIERLARDLSHTKPVLALVAVSYVQAPTPVAVRKCHVTHAWYRGGWWRYDQTQRLLVSDLHDLFWQRVDRGLERVPSHYGSPVGLLMEGWRPVKSEEV